MNRFPKSLPLFAIAACILYSASAQVTGSGTLESGQGVVEVLISLQ